MDSLKRQLALLKLERKEIIISRKILEIEYCIEDFNAGKIHNSSESSDFTHVLTTENCHGRHEHENMPRQARFHSSPCTTQTAYNYPSTNQQTASRDVISGVRERDGRRAQRHDQQAETWHSATPNRGDNVLDELSRGGDYARSRSQSTSSVGDPILERISIPMFSGDRSKFESWYTAFSVVENSDESGKYKMLRLVKCVDKDIANVIEDFGYTDRGYRAAINYLIDNYGGKKRTIQERLRKLRNFRQLRHDNSSDLKNLAHLVKTSIVNIKSSGRKEDLHDSMMYLIILSKLPRQMLIQYHEWRDVNNYNENVTVISAWLEKQAKYTMLAEEDSESQDSDHEKNHHEQSYLTMRMRQKPWTEWSRKCKICKTGNHGAWACHIFKKKKRSEKWKIAEKNKLCYRCLSEDHGAKTCKRKNICGVNGCEKTHHQLLHGEPDNKKEPIEEKQTTENEPCIYEWFDKRQTVDKTKKVTVKNSEQNNRHNETNVSYVSYTETELDRKSHHNYNGINEAQTDSLSQSSHFCSDTDFVVPSVTSVLENLNQLGELWNKTEVLCRQTLSIHDD